ncbi:MAG: hypothetical protein JXL80_02710 [Planctomycetes bacterium]|nr:hypothetical protein [Planctomycetota bacterium]
MPHSSSTESDAGRLSCLTASPAFSLAPLTSGPSHHEPRLILLALLLPLLAGAASSTQPAGGARVNLLANGGFEQHDGIGTIPRHWQVLDENFEYFGWIGPRVERQVSGILPRTGRFMVGLATDAMNVDTNDREYHIPRSAIYQTIAVPGRGRGTFAIYYNDFGSSALAHTSAIRLAYTISNDNPAHLRFPAAFSPEPAKTKPGIWSCPFFRVSQRLPHSQTAVGDWTRAAIPVRLDRPEPEIRLTLWIGIFDHQNSTELAYYRIDDASFTLAEALR